MIPHDMLKDTGGDDCRLLLRPGQRLLLLLCVILLCWIVSSVVNGLILSKFGMTTRVLRIVAVLQSVFQIITPSLITALMVSRRPARFLEIDRSPGLNRLVWGILLLFVSIPAMNIVVEWNAGLQLPEVLGSFSRRMHELEDNAAATIRLLQGGSTVGDLILNILIIGVMAGLGEELLFRGTIQRMLTTSGMNPHLAIWLVAVLFSAIHMQFFGFVPRMLLGAVLGYLLYWSNSLWLPVCVHAGNNILYVTARWVAMRHGADQATLDSVGTDGGQWIYVCLSVVFTALVLLKIKLSTRREVSVK